MENWIMDIINRFGYIGVTLLIAVENIFPPIPSELILTFSGFVTTYTALNVFLVIAAATLGSVIGALALYMLGNILKAHRLENLIKGKIGRILHLKNGDILRAVDWFESKGKSTVFFCRFIPIIRSLISIPAGIANMELGIFLIYTTVGSVIWNTVLIFLGMIFGSAFGKIADYFSTYSAVTLVLILLVVFVGCSVYAKHRFYKKDSSSV